MQSKLSESELEKQAGNQKTEAVRLSKTGGKSKSKGKRRWRPKLSEAELEKEPDDRHTDALRLPESGGKSKSRGQGKWLPEVSETAADDQEPSVTCLNYSKGKQTGKGRGKVKEKGKGTVTGKGKSRSWPIEISCNERDSNPIRLEVGQEHVFERRFTGGVGSEFFAEILYGRESVARLAKRVVQDNPGGKVAPKGKGGAPMVWRMAVKGTAEGVAVVRIIKMYRGDYSGDAYFKVVVGAASSDVDFFAHEDEGMVKLSTV